MTTMTTMIVTWRAFVILAMFFISVHLGSLDLVSMLLLESFCAFPGIEEQKVLNGI